MNEWEWGIGFIMLHLFILDVENAEKIFKYAFKKREATIVKLFVSLRSFGSLIIYYDIGYFNIGFVLFISKFDWRQINYIYL